MKKKIYTEVYCAIVFICLGIMTIANNTAFPWIFLAIGIISALFVRIDYKKIGEKEFDKLFDVTDE